MGEGGGVNWWLIIRNQAGEIFAWEVWPDGELPDDQLINAARVAVGFPADDAWSMDGTGWDIQLTLDRPHKTLMDRATVGTVETLGKADPAAVQAHADARAEATRRAHIDELRARLAGMDDDTLSAVLGGRAAVESLRAAHVREG
jgi:hypothetical protein